MAEVVPEHSKALEAPDIDPLNHSNQIYTNLSYFQTCALTPLQGVGAIAGVKGVFYIAILRRYCLIFGTNFFHALQKDSAPSDVFTAR